MKTKLTLLLTIIFIVIISCERNNEVSPPEIEILTSYSWKEYKYYIRFEDSSLYDNSELWLLEECDTTIYTFNINNSFIKRKNCETNLNIEYWQYNSNNNKINIYYDSVYSDYDYTYIIEEINNDTLKLFLVPLSDPNEQVNGNLIYLYSIPKEI